MMGSEVKVSFTYVKVCLTIETPRRTEMHEQSKGLSFIQNWNERWINMYYTNTCMFIFTPFFKKNNRNFMYLQYDTLFLLTVKIVLYLLYINARHRIFLSILFLLCVFCGNLDTKPVACKYTCYTEP